MSGFLVSGCSRNNSGTAANAKHSVISATVLQPQTIPLFRNYVARTAAFFSVDVRPRVSGELTGYNFEAGQEVRKGRLLFQIDPAPYQLAVQEAQAHLLRAQSDRAESLAQLNKAKADVARYEPLAKIHAIPEQDLADARATETVREAQLKQTEAEIQVQQSSVNQAKLKLAYTSIYSPLTGTIGQREVDPGNLVNADQQAPLATVSSDDPVLVTFAVSDAEYLQFFAPQPKAKHRADAIRYELLLANGERYRHPGAFRAISRALNQQTDTLTVVLVFPNPDHVLRPNQFAQVRADLQQQQDALLVPVTAVTTLQGTQSVLLVDHRSVVVQRTISTSARVGDSYVVSGGLQPGDRVIVEGGNKVQPGDVVTVQTAEPKHTTVAGDVFGDER